MFMNRNASRGRKKSIRRFTLLCLSVLLFWGGWSFIASIRMIMSIMEISLGAALSMFFRNISFFTAFFSGKSLLIGTILGLLMFFRLRNRNAEETAEEETAEEAKESAPEEEEIIETTHYRFH